MIHRQNDQPTHASNGHQRPAGVNQGIHDHDPTHHHDTITIHTIMAEFESMSYRELQTKCKELGIKASGKKDDLVARLVEHQQQPLPADSGSRWADLID